MASVALALAKSAKEMQASAVFIIVLIVRVILVPWLLPL
jgi:diacylglycerol kinase